MSGRKPSRLGMGLSALLGEAGGDAGSTPRSLPVGALEPGPFQPRGPISQPELSDLAASIRAHGVLQPILVRPKPGAAGTYQIIGGERRWRASQLAQLHEVPVVVRDLDDRGAMAAALVENLQRQDLNALEEAEGYQRLIREFGLTQDALGQSVGKSRSHVANTMRLLALPDPVREMLRDGRLSAGHARALLTAPEPARLAALVVSRGLNVRQAEALATQAPRSGTERPFDPDAEAVARDLMARLGMKVELRRSGRGGRLTLHFGTLDQLDGLLRLLNPDA
ncbi:ParB family chromosome partitioning protein [Humitalea rosea]|uniref:ParB family chromosome partitioning protein n=1 Tax=Humitalea rosea TaxID=990373 RepID=A0A2W7KFY0_9PROT|nr:ParB/RepB/Spo0J family partition protein [Humitalea rosea]PZW46579.1 ParB family chromosome partitioning protein [Humitalea rosea]